MKFFLFLCLFTATLAAKAQNNLDVPPYKRFPSLPPLQLLLGDSTTKYAKDNIPANKPVLIMMFDPECSHCQQSAEEMYQHKDKLKDIQIVLATIAPIYQMNSFMQKYKLLEMKNVVAGKDIYFLLPPFFSMRSFPFLASYNKKGDLIEGMEGSFPVDKVIQKIKQSK
jgi:thioredoxin-related protein